MIDEIHQKKRMPIILKKEDEKDWLGGKEINDFKYPYSNEMIAMNLDNRLSLF